MRLLQPVCPGQPKPGPAGQHPPTARVCSSCLLATTKISWMSPLYCRLLAQAAPRTVRAAPDARMEQNMAGTSHQGHGMGHSPALHRPLRGQTAGVHHRFSHPGGTRLEAAVGYTPTGYCPCLLSAQSRETPNTSGSCSGTS